MIDPSHFNVTAFLWLNHATSSLPDWLWASLTITGHTSILFALLSPLLLPRLGRSDVMTGLFATALLGGVVSWLVKESFQIPRPPAVLTADQFHLIGHKLELVSFPSGHTLSAFAVATLLVVGLRLRGWHSACLLLLASCVGLSRVAVGAHWPLDVLGGAVVGAVGTSRGGCTDKTGRKPSPIGHAKRLSCCWLAAVFLSRRWDIPRPMGGKPLLP